MDDSARPGLALKALNLKLEQRRPSDVIHHSRQDGRYAALACDRRCGEVGRAALAL